MRYIPLTFLLCSIASAQVVDPPLRVTVRSDDVTCVVLDKVMPCTEVSVYLLQTLHFPFDRAVAIFLEGLDPTESRGSSLATTLHDAGFRAVTVVGFITEPNHAIQNAPSGAR
jgi:hypothetical protein